MVSYALGCLVSHCQNVRYGGRAMKWPLPTVPTTSIRSTSGTSGPHGARTFTWPLRTATSSVSTTMPGLMMRMMCPLRISASSRSVGRVMTAWVKSRFSWPLRTRASIRCGTTHRPSRLACPLPQSIRTTSLTRGAGALATNPEAGRSATRRASSP